MRGNLEAVGEDGGFVTEGFLPDGVGGDVIEAPGGTGVIDEGLAGDVGGLDDSVTYAACALFVQWHILYLILHF